MLTIGYASFVEERINTTIERCGSVISVNDFLASPDKMDILMRLVCVCKP